MTTTSFLIVGASLAGAKAAEALRTAGYDGRLTLIGAESSLPYERPPLSKGFLLGKTQHDETLVHPESWYAEQQVDLRLNTVVTDIDRPGRAVVTATGERIGYDKLLLTTGATPRPLPVPGGETAVYLRTIEDSERLRELLTAGAKVVVVGGGWIGMETAAAARSHDCEVTVIEPQPTPLHAVLGSELGEVFARVHRDNGVHLRLGTSVTEIRDHAVVTSAGDVLPADVVIAGIGAQPATGLAERAGLTVDNGIVVDATLHSSDDDVFAAGDVANAWHPRVEEHVRVEHWANALNQGLAAGASMLGDAQPYDRVPYFFTDQFSLGMEYSGYVSRHGYDEVVYRGDPESGEFIAFWLRQSRVLAGMNVNVWDVTDPIQALVRAGWGGQTVDRSLLADPAVALSDALQPASR
ncbi:MAG: NAD(P)/FAD-dependent oxidoreductase [Mycobacteriales bacterium]